MESRLITLLTRYQFHLSKIQILFEFLIGYKIKQIFHALLSIHPQ